MNLYLYSADRIDSASFKWDYGLLKEFCERKGINQVHVGELPFDDKAFVAIPGPSNRGYEHIIQEELKKIKHVVLFIMGDEQGLLNIDNIKHEKMVVYVQYPHNKHNHYNYFPQGVPQHFNNMEHEYKQKEYDLYFSGQINHSRRRQLADSIVNIPNALFNPTEGFTQGVEPPVYYDLMSKARMVPCPSGIQVLDSFRFYEALELLALPLADSIDPMDKRTMYFERLFGNTMKCPSIQSWNDLPDLMVELKKDYPRNMHAAVTWWIKYKRDLFNKLMEYLQ
jgi:hypothetical protein